MYIGVILMLANELNLEPYQISLWKMIMAKDSFRVSKSMADLERENNNRCHYFDFPIEKKTTFFVEVLSIDRVFSQLNEETFNANAMANKMFGIRAFEEKWKEKLLSAFAKKLGSNVLTRVKELISTTSPFVSSSSSCSIDDSSSSSSSSFLIKGFGLSCGVQAIRSGGRSLDEPQRSELLEVVFMAYTHTHSHTVTYTERNSND